VFDNQTFQKLVEADNLTGEVVATNSFIVEVRGLEGVCLGFIRRWPTWFGARGLR
jgi:hypothetical protein